MTSSKTWSQADSFIKNISGELSKKKVRKWKMENITGEKAYGFGGVDSSVLRVSFSDSVVYVRLDVLLGPVKQD